MPANTNTDLRNGVNGDVGCKYPCDCATTAPIELEGTQTIDGFPAVENKIVLVKNQADKTENGPYVVSTGSWERGVWFNSSLNATAGSLITVAYGAENQKTIWETVCADANIDFGTSEIDFELKVKGSNTGDKSIALTGPVTGTSTESTPGVLTVATTIENDAVTTSKILDANVPNAKLANMAAITFKMRVTGSTGAPEDGTATQATAALNTMVGDSGSGGLKGLAPAPVSGDAAAGKFLKADGNWQIPPLSDAFPTGGIVPFPANIAPSGWLELDGSLVSRSTYSALWTYAQASGNIVAEGSWTAGKFSTGNTTTTFRLPDMRGCFVRGWSNGGSIDSGRAIGSIQQDAFQGHQHSAIPKDGLGGIGFFAYGAATTQAAIATTGIVTDGTNGTPRTATETRPINLAFMYCIKT